MENIQLSTADIAQMFKDNEALTWARKAVNGIALSERETQFGKYIEGRVEEAWKTGSSQALVDISAVIVKIIEPEIYNYPKDLMAQSFEPNAIGEYDIMKFDSKWVNGLVARENAIRTGAVEKSYMGLIDSDYEMKNLEINTEINTSELRKPNGLGVAQLSLSALESFDNKKYLNLLNFIENKICVTGKNKFAGQLNKGSVEDFLNYLYENGESGKRNQIVGLASNIRKLSKNSTEVSMMSEIMKDELNNNGVLKVCDNNVLFEVKDGNKDGEGNTLIPADTLYGFCGGRVGSTITRGQMRVKMQENPASEKLSIYFKGVEFGYNIYKDQARKIAIFKIEEAPSND